MPKQYLNISRVFCYGIKMVYDDPLCKGKLTLNILLISWKKKLHINTTLLLSHSSVEWGKPITVYICINNKYIRKSVCASEASSAFIFVSENCNKLQ